MAAVAPKKASEKVQDDALDIESVDLSTAPKLRPYNTLRMRERARIIAVVDGLDDFKDANGDPREPTMAESFQMLATMDEALESVALNPAEYLAWLSSDNGGEVGLTALFLKYAEKVGNFTGSAN